MFHLRRGGPPASDARPCAERAVKVFDMRSCDCAMIQKEAVLFAKTHFHSEAGGRYGYGPLVPTSQRMTWVAIVQVMRSVESLELIEVGEGQYKHCKYPIPSLLVNKKSTESCAPCYLFIVRWSSSTMFVPGVGHKQ